MNDEEPQKAGAQADGLSVNDLASFLKKLANLYRHPAAGNERLASALVSLGAALQRSSRRPLGELLESIRQLGASARTPGARRARGVPRGDLADLTGEDVRRILEREDVTKAELVDVGCVRFGIPSSGLERLTKPHLIDRVRAALRNEESLEKISDQARSGGAKRSS